jgi:hypothetical protein
VEYLMTEKSHWPFTGDIWASAGRKAKRTEGIDPDRARLADLGALRARARHDRLIVGGRAHTKKHGLS